MSFQRDKLLKAVIADDARALQKCFQRDPKWLHTRFAHPTGWKWDKMKGWRGKQHFYKDDKREPCCVSLHVWAHVTACVCCAQ